MKLTLDHTQRLNLHALLGAQRADVGSIRAIWAVQDRIALDADEEKAVELKREMVAGQERVVWNPALSLPPRISSSPIRRSRASEHPSFLYGHEANVDRRWLEPLLCVLSADIVG